MKNIFKIHITTYIFYILLILSGYINYLFIFLIIIVTHELGHIFTIYLCKLRINEIIIYPFGGVIKTNINYNINSNKLLFISISGVLFQTLLFLIIKDNSSYTYQIFESLNLSIIIFNLIPIYPSDGNKILVSILERIQRYKNTLYITNIISFIFLFIVFILRKNIFIFIVLYYLNINYFSLTKYIFNKFLLERYLYDKKYKKNKYINTVNHIYKCRNNCIKCDNIYIEEKKYFQNKFE
ncbi:MAG: site-2 protease family protein [Erysipelotrichales bacterium]|nr:site-2 protease family protein [Erysipelotrichales bacterium]